MDLAIALDGPRRRDIEVFAGDEVTLNVAVYAVDGDLSPVVVTNLVMSTTPSYGSFTIPVGVQYTVSDEQCGRHWYWIKGDIAGVTTTVAYGLYRVIGGRRGYPSGTDYGWGYCGPWGGWW